MVGFEYFVFVYLDLEARYTGTSITATEWRKDADNTQLRGNTWSRAT